MKKLSNGKMLLVLITVFSVTITGCATEQQRELSQVQKLNNALLQLSDFEQAQLGITKTYLQSYEKHGFNKSYANQTANQLDTTMPKNYGEIEIGAKVINPTDEQSLIKNVDEITAETNKSFRELSKGIRAQNTSDINSAINKQGVIKDEFSIVGDRINSLINKLQ